MVEIIVKVNSEENTFSAIGCTLVVSSVRRLELQGDPTDEPLPKGEKKIPWEKDKRGRRKSTEGCCSSGRCCGYRQTQAK
jgi:hypothetical protein